MLIQMIKTIWTWMKTLPGWHIVLKAGGEVLQYWLHCMSRLLPEIIIPSIITHVNIWRFHLNSTITIPTTKLTEFLPSHSQVFLKRSWKWRKNSLRGLIWGERLLPTSCVLLPHSPNVCERLLGSCQQSCSAFSYFSLVLVLFVIPLVVRTVSPAFACLTHHCWVSVVSTAIDVVNLVARRPFPSLGARKGLQVRVVDGELNVVLLKNMSSRPLDRQVAKWEGRWLTVWTANHLDTILGGEVSQFEEKDGEVVDKEQGVDQRESKLDDVLVRNLSSGF